MPDRYGRFSMGDGLAIANTMSTMSDRAEDRRDKAEKKLKEKKMSIYLNTIGSGGQIDRGSEDFDYGLYLDASQKHMEGMLKDQAFQQNQNILNESKLKQQEYDISDRIARAKWHIDAGSTQKASQVLAPIYDYFPDGNKFVRFTDSGGIVLKDSLGNEFEEPAMDVHDMLGMAEKFSETGRETDAKFQDTRKKWNMKALSKREIHKADDGTEALYFLILGKDGEPKHIWKDMKTGQTIKGFDPTTGEDVKSNLRFYSTEQLENRQKLKKGGLDITSKEIANKRARAEAGKADIISPGSIVTGGDGTQQGVIRGGKGGLALDPVEGGVKLPAKKGTTGPSFFAKEDYKRLSKSLTGIEKTINEGYREDEMGLLVPLTLKEKGELSKIRNKLVSEMNTIKGGKASVAEKKGADENTKRLLGIITGHKTAQGEKDAGDKMSKEKVDGMDTKKGIALPDAYTGEQATITGKVSEETKAKGNKEIMEKAYQFADWFNEGISPSPWMKDYAANLWKQTAESQKEARETLPAYRK